MKLLLIELLSVKLILVSMNPMPLVLPTSIVQNWLLLNSMLPLSMSLLLPKPMLPLSMTPKLMLVGMMEVYTCLYHGRLLGHRDSFIFRLRPICCSYGVQLAIFVVVSVWIIVRRWRLQAICGTFLLEDIQTTICHRCEGSTYFILFLQLQAVLLANAGEEAQYVSMVYISTIP